MWLLNAHVHRGCSKGKRASSGLSPLQGHAGADRRPERKQHPVPAPEPRRPRSRRAARRWLPGSSGMDVLVQKPPPSHPRARRAVRKAPVALPARVRKEENAGSVWPRASEREKEKSAAASHLRQVPAGNRAAARGRVCNPRIGDPAEVSSPAGSYWRPPPSPPRILA